MNVLIDEVLVKIKPFGSTDPSRLDNRRTPKIRTCHRSRLSGLKVISVGIKMKSPT
jgi:hypothetical protein